MKKTLERNFDVGLFFFVKGRFLIHGCRLKEAEIYGDFRIYPGGHFPIWEQHYAPIYKVDYDYYPRGRILFRKSDGAFVIFHDRCIEKEVHGFFRKCFEAPLFELDEHYQCRLCNPDYVILSREEF